MLFCPQFFPENIMNYMNTCGQCAQHFEGLAKDDQDPRLQLTLVTGAGRVSVSRRLLQLLSPLVRQAVSRMVELVLTRLNSVDTSGVQLNDELSLF